VPLLHNTLPLPCCALPLPHETLPLPHATLTLTRCTLPLPHNACRTMPVGEGRGFARAGEGQVLRAFEGGAGDQSML
jgi:hypothetical protein